MSAGMHTAVRRVRSVVFGRDDPRLRATWRVLLAVPLLLVTGVVARLVTPALGISGMLPAGLVQAAAFGVLLVGWARYVDRRRLAAYGFSHSGTWLAQLAVAFLAVLLAQCVWYALGSTLGWTSVELTGTTGSTTLFGLATVFVALAVNVWVQETVFFGVVLQSAAEGLNARGLAPERAVLGGWLVGAVSVVAIHSGGFRPGLLVAGLVFGLLYVHSGELALPIGFHLAVNFTGGWVFTPLSAAGERTAIFAVSESAPAFQSLSAPAIPQMLLGYLIVVGWLRLRGHDVGIDRTIARWTPR